MWWLQFRQGPAVDIRAAICWVERLWCCVCFILMRGRIRIDGEKTGRTITRFKAVERFGHWLLAGSFMLLGLTGLISLLGASSDPSCLGTKLFRPSRSRQNGCTTMSRGLLCWRWSWFLSCGSSTTCPNGRILNGCSRAVVSLARGHPPAKKFNAGQKLIFWSVIVLGAPFALPVCHCLFPFELPMFAATFAKLNASAFRNCSGWANCTPSSRRTGNAICAAVARAGQLRADGDHNRAHLHWIGRYGRRL